MKAKNSLQPELVVASALRIIDEQGLDGLTVRKVVDEFGVTPMALYWHFSNKEALLEAVGDAVIANLRMPDESLPLESYLREAMVSLADIMRAHPSATPLVAQRLFMNECGRDMTEIVLEKLSVAGFGIEKSASIAHYALMLTMTLVTGEPGAETAVKPDEREAAIAAKSALLHSLPEDRYPRLRAAAPVMVECGDSDDYYGAAIDIFVSGVMADVEVLARP